MNKIQKYEYQAVRKYMKLCGIVNPFLVSQKYKIYRRNWRKNMRNLNKLNDMMAKLAEKMNNDEVFASCFKSISVGIPVSGPTYTDSNFSFEVDS